MSDEYNIDEHKYQIISTIVKIYEDRENKLI